jgi:putative tricarboxylic transport membrane protein
MIGVYGLKFNALDLYRLLAFGLTGLLMRLNGFPLAPLILVLILGNLVEENMRHALQISSGDWMTFLDKPTSASLLVIALVWLFLPSLLKKLRAKKCVVASAPNDECRRLKNE